MSTTSWLERNSNTPSLATTKKRWAGVISTLFTSGSAMTPTASAATSPRLRVKAVPG
uniref:Uncharacterized protein n=1 Tax=Arundo donax TaxID=35708 RepID=A0A0A9EZB0_ARUDO